MHMICVQVWGEKSKYLNDTQRSVFKLRWYYTDLWEFPPRYTHTETHSVTHTHTKEGGKEADVLSEQNALCWENNPASTSPPHTGMKVHLKAIFSQFASV